MRTWHCSDRGSTHTRTQGLPRYASGHVRSRTSGAGSSPRLRRRSGANGQYAQMPVFRGDFHRTPAFSGQWRCACGMPRLWQNAHPRSASWGLAVQISRQTQNEDSQYRTTVGHERDDLGRSWKRKKRNMKRRERNMCQRPLIIHRRSYITRVSNPSTGNTLQEGHTGWPERGGQSND